MNKLKLFLFLFTAAALTAAIAMLPQAAALIQDSAVGNEAKYSALQTIQLHFGEEAAQTSMLAKLSMMKQSFYSIPDDKASMTREEVRKAIDKGLAPYDSAGLLWSQWGNASESLTPYLVYGANDDYCIFWEVAFSTSKYDEGFCYLNLHIDDETGKIIDIYYQWDLLCLGMEERCALLEPLIEIYFETLGLSASADYAETENLAEDISSDTANITARRYIFDDAIYGQIVVEFYIHQEGFYVHLPRETG